MPTFHLLLGKISRHNLKTHTDNAQPGKKVNDIPSEQNSLFETPPSWARVEKELDDRQIEETAEFEEYDTNSPK